MINGLERGAIHPTALVSDRARLGGNVSVGAYAIINDGVHLGDGSIVGPHVVLGEPQMGFYRGGAYEQPALRIGAGALIRSGAMIYAGTTIGDGFECGHRVTIREGATIGQDVRIGTQSDIQGHCEIGNHVRIHSNVFVAHGAVVRDFAWLFPHVVLTNDPHPPSEVLLGVTVDEFGAVGAGAIVMPGVTIGRDALVGAGALVRSDVPPEAVVVGNPARQVATVRDIRSKETGEPVYPWREHFTRGMPWAGIGYEQWAGQDR